jgi:serine/threonine protein kinase
MARLGKYELVRPLAAGGMAEIFLARQSGPGGFQKTVVLKRLHPRLARDEDLVRMFVDEARIAARLTHTNIVQIYDLGATEGNYYIAMEYVRGHDLREIQDQEIELGVAMSYGLVAYIVGMMCRGLHYAHTLADEKGEPLRIVHRDVSPQNVLVSFEGDVKLADFGIAKAASRAAETQAGILKGKVAYMSPEHCQGQPVDARSDIFSAGILLYELTCRRRLFRRNSDFATMRAVLKDPIPPPSAVVDDVPDALEAVIMRALARDPGDRFQDAHQMHQELEQASRDSGQNVGANELATHMAELFADEVNGLAPAVRQEGAREEDTQPDVAGAPPGSPQQAVTVRSFVEVPTVPGEPARRSSFAEEVPTAPAVQPRLASGFPVEPTTMPDGKGLPIDAETVIQPPSFDDLAHDIPEDAVETVGGPPPPVTIDEDAETVAVIRPPGADEDGPASGSLPPPLPPTPKASVAPKPTAPVAPKPRAAEPGEAKRREELKAVPTVAATPKGRMERRRQRAKTRILVVVAIALMLAALGLLGIFLWKRGLLGTKRTAVVRVVSQPPGAAVYLDGEKRFGVTPVSLYGVTPKQPHKLVVALEGYAPWRTKFTLEADELDKGKRIDAKLKRTGPGGAPAALIVRVNEQDAQVYLDGEYQGRAPLSLERVKSGVEHVLVIKKEGFDNGVVQIDALKPGEKRAVQVTLSRPEGKLIKGVDKPRREALAPGPVTIPRVPQVPLNEGMVGERVPRLKR